MLNALLTINTTEIISVWSISTNATLVLRQCCSRNRPYLFSSEYCLPFENCFEEPFCWNSGNETWFPFLGCSCWKRNKRTKRVIIGVINPDLVNIFSGQLIVSHSPYFPVCCALTFCDRSPCDGCSCAFYSWPKFHPTVECGWTTEGVAALEQINKKVR